MFGLQARRLEFAVVKPFLSAQWFSRIDADRSGKLDVHELQKALALGGLNFSLKTVAVSCCGQAVRVRTQGCGDRHDQVQFSLRTAGEGRVFRGQPPVQNVSVRRAEARRDAVAVSAAPSTHSTLRHPSQAMMRLHDRDGSGNIRCSAWLLRCRGDALQATGVVLATEVAEAGKCARGTPPHRLPHRLACYSGNAGHRTQTEGTGDGQLLLSQPRPI